MVFCGLHQYLKVAFSFNIAKAVFDPDKHPERAEFLLRSIRGDDTIKIERSSRNEGIRISESNAELLRMEGETGMKIYTLAGGDEVHRFDRSILVSFSGRRKVLSTAPLHGGYRTDMTGALNHDGNYGRGCLVEMKADTYRGHMRLTLQEIGLPEETTAGLETAAQMENASIVTESFRDLSVTAITTAGIEASGGRVGDPASWYEEKGEKKRRIRSQVLIFWPSYEPLRTRA